MPGNQYQPYCGYYYAAEDDKLPWGMKRKTFNNAAKVVAIFLAAVVIWKLGIELPRAWQNAKTTSEKISALTILV